MRRFVLRGFAIAICYKRFSVVNIEFSDADTGAPKEGNVWVPNHRVDDLRDLLISMRAEIITSDVLLGMAIAYRARLALR